MLVLTRKLGEKIAIGNEIMVVVTEIRGTHVKLGVEAPKTISIYREEVLARTIRENRDAAGAKLQGLQKLLSKEFSSGIKKKKKEKKK